MSASEPLPALKHVSRSVRFRRLGEDVSACGRDLASRARQLERIQADRRARATCDTAKVDAFLARVRARLQAHDDARANPVRRTRPKGHARTPSIRISRAVSLRAIGENRVCQRDALRVPSLRK